MTNFYVTYHCGSKEVRDRFYTDIKANQIGEKSRAEAGCIRYDYFFPADDDTRILLWEQWESREAQKVHTTQPHFPVTGALKEKHGITTDFLVQDAME